MASNELTDNDFQHNTREIHPDSVTRDQPVGEGSFGVVYKGQWEGNVVAIKMITRDAEKKAFLVEVKQLSRVNHENIVKLYGACTRGTEFFLVMEYAEGGSLFNVLHKSNLGYNLAHAMSWAYQCALGVEYLHAMKPKALIHRDLKPPNLLLINGGVTLKICDFGTAADKNTYMTNNKGSAAWMAPEVFTSSQYTEKCDVFSWGIILWEVISRKKPFYNQANSAFTIMWAVHKGKRPPLIRNCPLPIEKLMTESWDQNPEKRPSMEQIVDQMQQICSLLPGADDPIACYDYEQDEEYVEETEIEEIFTNNDCNDSSVRTLPQPTSEMKHLTVECDPHCWDLPAPDEGQTSLKLNDILPTSCSQNVHTLTASEISSIDLDDEVLLNGLDAELRPATPDPNDPQSMAKYEEHRKLAKDYWKMQTEIFMLDQRKRELLKQQEEETERQRNLQKLQEEKQSLRLIRDLYEQQSAAAPNSGVSGWVVVPSLNQQNENNPH